MRYQFRAIVVGMGAQGKEFRFVPTGFLTRQYRYEAVQDADSWNRNRRYTEGVAIVERQAISEWEADTDEQGSYKDSN